MLATILCAWFGIFCIESPVGPTGPPKFDTPELRPSTSIAAPELDTPELDVMSFYSFLCERQPPDDLKNYYHFAAKNNVGGLDECTLANQGFHESGFDIHAVSPADAKGVCQFLDSVAEEYGIDQFDPEECIFAQAQYMVWAIDRWTPGLGGRTYADLVKLALATYNWGLGNMYASQREHGWVTYAELEPFLPEETRNYVRRILGPEWWED